MKVSVAVLSCLMLVTALGSQAQVTNDAETGFMMSKLSLANPEVPDMLWRRKIGPQTIPSLVAGSHADCCTSYIPGRIPCSLLESYLETSSKCSKPGVIFLTKNGRRLCVSPSNKQVLACRIMLKLATQIKASKN
ncbi:PREDICTED: C-C motif chemokine 23 isoform X1 [Colobus angolensis palliatus]|uniref:C-C motif chemokine 23 isoform X1 n=1 Tax=Colobus angolensis palliatus TaxID=336983 RepID=UPI0005F3F6F8|nr:PREDICTED: C-C motif chemokine 23 isoform X1 [Colobus angolensis palliatus]